MGWRFRRSVKIAPGVRLNVSKRSVGMSVGPRGAKVSVNSKGEVRRTVGVPGTGLSHTTQARVRSGGELEPAEVAELTPADLSYLRGRYFRRLVGWGSALTIVLLIFAGAGTLAGYLILPAIGLVVGAPWISRLIWR